ncbi:PadR family transcriptional regulator [Aureibacillus halotolerans]|uniref:PadR family transcriptional regulator n=1 Tax=Aureibacillus halotolerans TaxID=1508390 RepID=A0A4V3D5X8_9BACI|nr:PadR family transcriptional regulator [Aureibacillus halotolerans]TDQ41617.1 PadR family transcriptional regulator [Aureibacillus halotolerans]
MSLRYAILGLLSKEPATGYSVTREFKYRITHFWSAHHTQIYRELVKMEAEGLVRSKTIRQSDFPDKKVYAVEEKGMTLLLHWLLQTPEKKETLSMKDPRLLRVSLLHLIDIDQSMAYLASYRDQHKSAQKEIKEWQSVHLESLNNEQFGEYLTSEFAIRYMEMWSDWCEWATSVLKEYKKKGDLNETQHVESDGS